MTDPKHCTPRSDEEPADADGADARQDKAAERIRKFAEGAPVKDPETTKVVSEALDVQQEKAESASGKDRRAS